ncbi:unnamed protein product [Linum tenue]|uniref:Uncharacterized protein n=1 Tax=Linum tenue TaxID=586396 RepID=A0AAV0KAZ4_9ROSI|nr:unnamed protein product [Linum tenue]
MNSHRHRPWTAMANPPPPPRPLTAMKNSRRNTTIIKKHKRKKMNPGKMIGLVFAGVAAILQVGVIGFLVFKRKQLIKDRYEPYSVS